MCKPKLRYDVKLGHVSHTHTYMHTHTYTCTHTNFINSVLISEAKEKVGDTQCTSTSTLLSFTCELLSYNYSVTITLLQLLCYSYSVTFTLLQFACARFIVGSIKGLDMNDVLCRTHILYCSCEIRGECTGSCVFLFYFKCTCTHKRRQKHIKRNHSYTHRRSSVEY
jgi:hypothetical protein